MIIRQSNLLGLLAGAGRFPLYLAKTLTEKNWNLVVIGPEGKLEPGIENYAYKIRTFRFACFGELVDILQEEGISQAIMAGKIEKRWMFEPEMELDELSLKILRQLPDRKDDTIMNAIVCELEERGIKILPTIELIKDWLAPKGVLGEHSPSEEQKKDISFGFKIAKEIGRLDIGQTVCVLNQAVLAVEAIEGTDLAILRAGEFSSGAVIVKVFKPNQSLKFDVPVVGKSTIQSMIRARASVLAVEAGRCLIVEKNEMLRLANEHKIALVGVEDGSW